MHIWEKGIVVAWTRPKTWSSEPLTSLDLNTYMRDNQNYLRDRLDNSVSRIISADSNFTSSSTVWVDIDSAAFSLTLTTLGGAVLLGFTGNIIVSKNRFNCYVNIAVDGVDHFGDDGVTLHGSSGEGDAHRPKSLGFVVLIPGLSAGSHTFVMRWKAQPGSSVIMMATSTHPQFWAKEV